MARVVIAVISGASLGGTYALIGLGLVLAFRATHTFNFAQGELMAFPAFILGFLLTKEQWGFGLALLVSLVIAAVLGMLMYWLALRRTVGLPVFMGVVATLGVATILDALISITFGTAQYAIRIPGMPS